MSIRARRSRDELLGMDVRQLEALDSPQNVTARFRNLIRLGSLRFESVHRRKDAGAYPVEVSARLRA